MHIVNLMNAKEEHYNQPNIKSLSLSLSLSFSLSLSLSLSLVFLQGRFSGIRAREIMIQNLLALSH